MRKFWNTIIIGLFLFICVGSLYAFTQSDAMDKLNAPLAPVTKSVNALVASSPVATATSTPVPTATQDYNATATQYQAQIDAANAQVVDAQAKANSALSTALYYSNAGIQITLSANEIILNSQHMTATQAEYIMQNPTPTPNATATAEHNAAIIESAKGLQAVASQVAEAPTRTIIMANANNEIKYGWVGNVLMIVALLVTLVIVYLIFRMVHDIHSQPVIHVNGHDETKEVPVNKSEPLPYIPPSPEPLKDGFVSLALDDHFIPCSPEQLTELAERILNGESAKFNNFEGDTSKWTRDQYRPMRFWLTRREYAEKLDGNRIKFVDRGLVFLRDWRDKNLLPAGIEFYPSHVDLREGMSHEHETHDEKQGGGVVISPLSDLTVLQPQKGS